jgi:hypothetical protein
MRGTFGHRNELTCQSWFGVPMTEINSARSRFQALPERYRELAKFCRDLAYNASNAHDEAAWLRLAKEWIALAERAEARRSVH